MYYYSPSTNGFYNSYVNTYIPSDAIHITDEQYNHLFTGVNNGYEIKLSNNTPTLITKQKISLTWNQIRQKRNLLLLKSDYTQLPDYPGDKISWASYRQKLRELPESFTNPEDVIWPIAPTNSLL